MNAALLSSKDMTWCTPQDFFDKLNAEFDFRLDAAATDKSAKCPTYYTPETDGLKSPWNVTGGRCSAIPHTGGRSESGFVKPTRNHNAGQRLFY